MPKINELPSASALTDTDVFALDNPGGTATRKVTAKQIKEFATEGVGAEVTDVKSAFEQYTGGTNAAYIGDFEKGSISTDGNDSTYRQNARARTAGWKTALFNQVITCGSDYAFMVYFDNGGEITYVGWVDSTGSAEIQSGQKYRILIRKPNADASSSVNSLENLVSGIFIHSSDFNNTVRLDFSNIKIIEENQDLDNLGIGAYICQTNAVAATLLNCPVTTNFRLTVSYNQASVRKLYWLVSGTGHIYWRIQSSSGYYAWKEIATSVDIENLQNEINAISASKSETNTFWYFNSSDFENGSLNEGESASYHDSCRVRNIDWEVAENSFEVIPHETYEMVPFLKTPQDVLINPGWFKHGESYIIPKNYSYRFLFRDSARDTSSATISVSEMLMHFTARYTEDIVQKNVETNELFPSLKRHVQDLRGGSTARRLNHNNLFTLAHISDIHLDGKRYQNFIDYCNAFDGFIDDRICTGDYVVDPTDEQIAHMRDHETVKTVLWCDGNHERNGGTTGLTRQQVYDKWGLSTWYAQTGATKPTGYAAQSGREAFQGVFDYPLFYHKDYVDSDSVSGYKIRLIVLNSCDFRNDTSTSSALPRYTTEQMTWFVDKLQDAATNGFAVILAAHYMESNIIAGENKSFYTRDNIDQPEVLDPSKGDVTVVENIIHAFRNGTSYVATNIKVTPADNISLSVNADFTGNPGQFLAWMVGHSHRDRIGYSENHPDQLILQVVDGCYESSLSGVTTQDMSNDSDLPRIIGDKSEDAFNVYAFDPVNKLVKVLRVGADMNDLMIPRKYASFDTEPLTT